VLGGGAPALTDWPVRIIGATTSIDANTARAADEERRGLDIARSRQAHRVAPTAPQPIGRLTEGVDQFDARLGLVSGTPSRQL
jgi:hypothetical protein